MRTCERCPNPVKRETGRFCSHACRLAALSEPRIDMDVRLLIDLYVSQHWSVRKIAGALNTSRSTVHWRLEQAGVTMRGYGYRSPRCVDCGKKLENGKRCAYHQRIRMGDLARERKRRQFSIPVEAWRVDY